MYSSTSPAKTHPSSSHFPSKSLLSVSWSLKTLSLSLSWSFSFFHPTTWKISTSLPTKVSPPSHLPQRLDHPPSLSSFLSLFSFAALAKDFLAKFADANGESKYLNILVSLSLSLTKKKGKKKAFSSSPQLNPNYPTFHLSLPAKCRQPQDPRHPNRPRRSLQCKIPPFSLYFYLHL